MNCLCRTPKRARWRLVNGYYVRTLPCCWDDRAVTYREVFLGMLKRGRR